MPAQLSRLYNQLEVGFSRTTIPPCRRTRDSSSRVKECRTSERESSSCCRRVGVGMPPGCEGVRTAGGPPGRRRERLKLAHGGAAHTTRTRPDEHSRRREAWCRGQRRSTCSPCNESIGEMRSPPRCAIAADIGAEAPENKSKKRPGKGSLSGDGAESPGRGRARRGKRV